MPNLYTQWYGYGTPTDDSDNVDPYYEGSSTALMKRVTGTAHVRTVGRSDTSSDLVWEFNASAYDSTYGNSETVQPPAITMRYCIKF